MSSAQPIPAREQPQPAPQHGWLQGRRKRPAKAARQLLWLYSTGQQELWASLTVCFPGWFLVHFAGNCRNTVGMRKGPVLSDVAFVPIALGSLHDLGAQPSCRAPGRAPGSPSALARAWCGTAHLPSTSLPCAAAPGSALGALQTLLRARRFALLQHFKKSKRCP